MFMDLLQQFAGLIPELFVLMMAITVLLVSLFLPKQEANLVWTLSVLAAFGGAVLVWLSLNLGYSPKELFGGHFVFDAFGQTLKLIMLGISVIAFIHGNSYLVSKKLFSGEYYSLLLFSLLGMMVLVSSGSMLTLYLGLELFSLPLYALIAVDLRAENTAEASMKYFVLGSLSSAILLYGMSLLFGATGTLALDAIASVLALEQPSQQILFGLIFVLVGVAFKFGAVPFHLWVPDIYQGAPISVTSFLASVPKIAAFGLAYRLLVEGLPSLSGYWEPILILLALLSLALGNILAIIQTDLRRMLAYSAIAHAGFILLGLVSGAEGHVAALQYASLYAIMSVGAFGCIAYLSAGEDKELYRIDQLQGLSSYRPVMALVLLLFMFSMAGIPPLVGFYAKLGVLRALINADLSWVAALSVVFSIIGAFYYLRVIRVLYFDKAPEHRLISHDIRHSGGLLVSMNGFLVLILGIFPSIIFGLCLKAF